jgi:hypothetical protein
MERLRGIAIVTVLVATLLPAAAAQGALIRYNANPDPTATDGYLSETGDQFWIHAGAGPSGVWSAINDSGTPAWQINSVGLVSPNYSHYRVEPTAADIADGNANGWVLEARVRVPTANQGLGGGSMAGYGVASHSKAWFMDFGSDADGDPMVGVWTADGHFDTTTYTLQAAGSGSYHTYELVYDPVARSADIFVDGVERISNYTGYSPYSGTFVVWGDGASGDDGVVNFNSVEWRTVPEPVTVGLLVLGGGLVLIRRHRRA